MRPRSILRSDGCIGFHSESLVKLAATREEVEEALSRAIYLGGDLLLMYAADAIASFDQFQAQAVTRPRAKRAVVKRRHDAVEFTLGPHLG